MLLCACSVKVDPDRGRLGPSDFIDAGADADGGVDRGVDAPPVCPESCDDGIECTTDSCTDGTCANMASDDSCDDNEICNPIVGCEPQQQCNEADECNDGVECTVDDCVEGVCRNRPNPESCQDDFPCTVDVCTPNGCQNNPDDSVCQLQNLCITGGTCDAQQGCVGGEKTECSDGSACTSDICEPSTGDCVNAPIDVDMDGFLPAEIMGEQCGGNDCDDSQASINPMQDEVCDGIDNNCMDGIDEGCNNNTCAGIEEIALRGSDELQITRRFADYSNTFGTPCADPGPDAFFYIDVPNNLDLRIEVEGRDPVLSVNADSCADLNNTQFCHDDIDNDDNDLDSRIYIHNFDGFTQTTQRLFLRVGSPTAGDNSEFTLTITPFDKPNDFCSDVLRIGLGAVFGKFGVANFQASRCGGLGQNEIIFRVRSSWDDDLVQVIEPTNSVVHVRAGCNSLNVLTCEPSPAGGKEIQIPNSNDNVRHIVVDGGQTNDPFFVRYRRRGTAD